MKSEAGVVSDENCRCVATRNNYLTLLAFRIARGTSNKKTNKTVQSWFQNIILGTKRKDDILLEMLQLKNEARSNMFTQL